MLTWNYTNKRWPITWAQ